MTTRTQWRRPRPENRLKQRATSSAVPPEGDELNAVYGFTAELLARVTGVHITTARGWKRGKPLPPPVARLLAIVLQGDLSRIDAEWTGWRLAGGRLIGPDEWSFKPGEILALPFYKQQIGNYQRKQRVALQADWVAKEYTEPGEHSKGDPEYDEAPHHTRRRRA